MLGQTSEGSDVASGDCVAHGGGGVGLGGGCGGGLAGAGLLRQGWRGRERREDKKRKGEETS